MEILTKKSYVIDRLIEGEGGDGDGLWTKLER